MENENNSETNEEGIEKKRVSLESTETAAEDRKDKDRIQEASEDVEKLNLELIADTDCSLTLESGENTEALESTKIAERSGLESTEIANSPALDSTEESPALDSTEESPALDFTEESPALESNEATEIESQIAQCTEGSGSLSVESGKVTEDLSLEYSEVIESPIVESTKTTENLTESIQASESLTVKSVEVTENPVLGSSETTESSTFDTTGSTSEPILDSIREETAPTPAGTTALVTSDFLTEENVNIKHEVTNDSIPPPASSLTMSSATTCCADSEGDNRGLMLIVGSENSTLKVMAILDSINETGIKMTMTPELKPEDAVRWKNQDVSFVVYVIDYSNPHGLKEVDDQLTYLHTHYLLPFDRIAFLLAHEPKDRNKDVKTIRASSIAAFMSKFRQPVINIIFNDGWEEDVSLQKQMRMFLNRFQELDNNDNANISNYSCPSSPQTA